MKELVPKRRFAGFSGEWEQSRLGDLADIVGGGTPSTVNPEYWNGDIDWYTPAEIINKVFVNSSERKISEKGFNNSSTRMLPTGTVLFTSRAGIGKTAILNRAGCTNQGFQSIVPKKDKLNTYFVYSKSAELKAYGEITGAGSTFVEVTGKQMENMLLFVPTLKEQIKIGSFFSNLDNLISLNEQKLDKLKATKSSYLSEMFPQEGELYPKRRFPGFTKPWERLKLGELGKIHTGNTPPTQQIEYWSEKKFGNVWVTPTDINTLTVTTSERFLSDIGWSIARTIPENSVLITSIASIGKNAVNLVPVAFNQQINAIVPQNNDSYFILTSMIKNKSRFLALAGRTATPIINKATFEDFRILMPTLPEQTKIGNFFSNLDSLISAQQNKLEKLKALKQAYLAEMFV